MNREKSTTGVEMDLSKTWPWDRVVAFFLDTLRRSGLDLPGPPQDRPLTDQHEPEGKYQWFEMLYRQEADEHYAEWQRRITGLLTWRQYEWLFPKLNVGEIFTLKAMARVAGDPAKVVAVLVCAALRTLTVPSVRKTDAEAFLYLAASKVLGDDMPPWSDNQRHVFPYTDSWGDSHFHDVGATIDFAARMTAEMLCDRFFVRYHVAMPKMDTRY